MIFIQGVVCNFPTSHPPATWTPTGSHVIAYVGTRGGVAFCRGLCCDLISTENLDRDISKKTIEIYNLGWW